MACECALKALLQKKAGRFRETHDLFVLYDDAVPYGFSLNRDLLKNIPTWRKMMELRYGRALAHCCEHLCLGNYSLRALVLTSGM